MKTTRAEYEQKTATMKSLNRAMRAAKETEGRWAEGVEIGKEMDALQAEYFDKLQTVNVEFYIGSRRYYEAVTKIGNTLFCQSRSMTKANGFHSVKEIEQITSKMEQEMLEDAMYY